MATRTGARPRPATQCTAMVPFPSSVLVVVVAAAGGLVAKEVDVVAVEVVVVVVDCGGCAAEAECEVE